MKSKWWPISLATLLVGGLAWRKYAAYDPPMTDNAQARHRAKLKAAFWEALYWGVIVFLARFLWKAMLEP